MVTAPSCHPKSEDHARRSIVLLPPTVAMAFGNNTKIISPAFRRGYEIVENIQVLAFTLQECIVLGLYI